MEPYSAVGKDMLCQPISKVDCSVVIGVARVAACMTYKQPLKRS